MSSSANPSTLSNIQLQFYLTSLDAAISHLSLLGAEIRDKIHSMAASLSPFRLKYKD